jgi:hypothetical protein
MLDLISLAVNLVNVHGTRTSSIESALNVSGDLASDFAFYRIENLWLRLESFGDRKKVVFRIVDAHSCDLTG